MVIENPWTRLRELTAARIALGRAGHSLPTGELLTFQLAHARARDAAHHNLDLTCFRGLNPIYLKTEAPDRSTYLRRPNLGRRLSCESAARLTRAEWDAVFVIADGLSSRASERYAGPLIEIAFSELPGWRMAPICVVEQGRVAVGDEIGSRIGASIAVVLIGERPGLSSPESLGAYLTWSPRVGRTDAERNCVSNIRSDGLSIDLAASRVAALMQTARERQLTGVHPLASRNLRS